MHEDRRWCDNFINSFSCLSYWFFGEHDDADVVCATMVELMWGFCVNTLPRLLEGLVWEKLFPQNPHLVNTCFVIYISLPSGTEKPKKNHKFSVEYDWQKFSKLHWKLKNISKLFSLFSSSVEALLEAKGSQRSLINQNRRGNFPNPFGKVVGGKWKKKFPLKMFTPQLKIKEEKFSPLASRLCCKWEK